VLADFPCTTDDDGGGVFALGGRPTLIGNDRGVAVLAGFICTPAGGDNCTFTAQAIISVLRRKRTIKPASIRQMFCFLEFCCMAFQHFPLSLLNNKMYRSLHKRLKTKLFSHEMPQTIFSHSLFITLKHQKLFLKAAWHSLAVKREAGQRSEDH
jgi:hypothetical protein